MTPEPASTRPGPLAVTAAFLALSASALLLARAAATRREPPPAEAPEAVPLLDRVPDFSLEERGGRTVAARDLRGKVWVVDFIFTSCAGICPAMSAGMRRVHEAMRGDADGLCVSVTVDPERDTPETLRRYAAEYGASPDRWLFLRGDQHAVHMLEYEGFHMGDPKDPFGHSQRAVLVDREGRIRGYYRITESEGVDQLLEAYRRVRDGKDG